MRVVVLTGAGNKAFVSGADISQFEKQRSNADAQQEYDRLTGAGRDKLARFPKPTIARIRGFCLGGGLAIAMQADLRIAARGQPVRHSGGAARHRLWVRRGAAAGRAGRAGARADDPLHRRSASTRAEAERIGPGQPRGARRGTVRRGAGLARTIADNAPLSVRGVQACDRPGAARPRRARHGRGRRRASEACFDSADYREGRTAFMEKRPPTVPGAVGAAR